LVSFSIFDKTFQILTDRQELTTFQIIMLYAYRWQIELLFRFLKRTMNGIHLIRNDKNGVTIQFYALVIAALLQLILKQKLLNEAESTQHGLSDKNNENEEFFFEDIGKKLKKYWKISIQWLTSLRSLLSDPFDKRATEILLSMLAFFVPICIGYLYKF